MITAGYKLNDGERAMLVGLRQMPGFQILLNIFESQVSQMQLDMINTPTDKPDQVLAAHNMAKAAAMFYQRTIDLMNNEIEMFGAQAKSKEIQPDITEEIFNT